MKYIVSTNIRDGIGLYRDAVLLRDMILAQHEVSFVDFRAETKEKADIVIFCETINPRHLALAPRRIWIPNAEWVTDELWDIAETSLIDLVLTKTLHAQKLLEKLNKTEYTGFISRDMFYPGVTQERRFFTMPGKGRRNLPAIEKAGLKPLLIVKSGKRVGDAALSRQMTRHAFHLCLGAYEGFGHNKYEAMSAGATIMAIDEPPMNEAEIPFLVPSIGWEQYHRVKMHEVAPEDIKELAGLMMDLSDAQIKKNAKLARAQWVENNLHASLRLKAALK